MWLIRRIVEHGLPSSTWRSDRPTLCRWPTGSRFCGCQWRELGARWLDETAMLTAMLSVGSGTWRLRRRADRRPRGSWARCAPRWAALRRRSLNRDGQVSPPDWRLACACSSPLVSGLAACAGRLCGSCCGSQPPGAGNEMNLDRATDACTCPNISILAHVNCPSEAAKMYISVADAHGRLSRLVGELKKGPVTITRRGKPVAC